MRSLQERKGKLNENQSMSQTVLTESEIEALLVRVLENQLLLLALSPGSDNCRDVSLAMSLTGELLSSVRNRKVSDP